jgi:hypothetical protein
MRDKILNNIIEFCIKKVYSIYNPYLIIATIGTSEAKTVIRELEKSNISNKEEYLRWEEDYLNYVKNNVDFLSKK